ncbi:hypothetical protein SAY87_004924 [Trapa incisa]|uniref:F-box domain-containing protein n=1 Tax=Trapa incisa TaxID=236973 RepID=A0AAN7PLU7_9MYRT|nr:hypothetical protein SAY87_004924 [Trapa incisa]
MGQSGSKAEDLIRQGSTSYGGRFKFKSKSKSSVLISPMLVDAGRSFGAEYAPGCVDYVSNLPDECLAYIFQFLGSRDRKMCSLVCRRWLRIEGQSRQRLSLYAKSDLIAAVPSLFLRFDAVTKLALKCDRKCVSISDDALILISLRCQNLTRLKLRSCRELTDAGMTAFAKTCKSLKKLSCGSCAFGSVGMNAILDNCASLEELSVKRLRGLFDGAAAQPIGPGAAAGSLKMICLKELYNGQCFGPLIASSKNLRTLRLFKCYGDWDKLFQVISSGVTGIVEIHLERINVTDAGLSALSTCSNIEILHLVRTVECTNFGLISIAERCKLLRKLHIDGGRETRIGDGGLIAVSKHCPNMQELVLIGVDLTKQSLDMLASNCQNLERLALCGSDTVGDEEISCIAAKCIALKKLCIKNCPISDQSMEALASGCPNLVKVKVKKCRSVTPDGVKLLRTSRGSLAVNLDTDEMEMVDANASDGVHEIAVEFPPIVAASAADIATAGGGIARRSPSLKMRLWIPSGRGLIACNFRWWSNGNGGHSPTMSS